MGVCVGIGRMVPWLILPINGKVDDKHYYVEIGDTGSGIDPDVLEHIFDPFFTTKGKKGTGLGMSIVNPYFS